MKQQLITAYVKVVSLSEDARAANGIRSKERLDCVAATLNGYKGFEPFVNAKGQLALWKRSCREGVAANVRRRAEWLLTNGTLNLSSIFIEDPDLPQYGLGFPNSKPKLSNGANNPLFNFRGDAYLFILNKELTEIEIFVIEQHRNLVTHCYQHLIDGLLDVEIYELRKAATPLFNYKGM